MIAKRTQRVQQPRAPASVGQSVVISTVEWLVNLIVLAIPLVGLVMCFVWAFGAGNYNRRNFARAALILMAAGLLLGIVLGSVVTPIYQSLMRSFLELIGK